MKLPFTVALAVVALGAMTLLPASNADIDSPDARCEVRLNGVSASDIAAKPSGDNDPLFLAQNETIDVDIITEHRIIRYDFFLQFGPISFPVYNGTASTGLDPSRDGFVLDSAKYTKYGTGLYTITGNITQQEPNGERHECNVVLLLHVGGNPLASVAGIVAMATAAGGLAGLIQALVGALMDSKEVVDSVKDLREFYKVARIDK